ncbi:hypothetical protein DL93DRAFT_1686048 [Clavulina sp. PMI_390]|nr:hypothetical protein DL93DRAFT_1686048 [Clavulina sp. PMI_390]
MNPMDKGVPASPGLTRTDTMFLADAMASPGRLGADQAGWPKSSSNPSSPNVSLALGGGNPIDDDMSAIDDDGFDIVEGLSSQGLGDMIQGIEEDDDDDDEEDAEREGGGDGDVVVDEMDGAGEGMPPVSTSPGAGHLLLSGSGGKYSSDDIAEELAAAVEEASKLPILHSPRHKGGLLPSPKPDQMSFGDIGGGGTSPLRSPRRGTLRQGDVSPSLLMSRTLPEDEDVAPMALPSSSTETTSPPPEAEVPSAEELEEVDLSTGPVIDDAEPEEATKQAPSQASPEVKAE